MRGIKVILIIVAALTITAALGGVANAFHDGGVATCTRCHALINPGSITSYLAGVDPGSTCLNCHEGSAGYYRVSTAESAMPAGSPPLQRGPGGDFGWLKKSYAWGSATRPQSSAGDNHGHNIIATGKNYNPLNQARNAPGSTNNYSSNMLTCASCHDPHAEIRRLPDGSLANRGGPPIAESGSYGFIPPAGEAAGAYRLLAGALSDDGAGYELSFYGAPRLTYANPFPAVAPSTYNIGESTSGTRVAYGHSSATGANDMHSIDRWCGNCHENLLNPDLKHPVQALMADERDNYNRYRKTGDLSGDVSTAYSSLIAIAKGTADIATLASVASTTPTVGAEANDRVTCLTCHRAHASGWDDMLRWNRTREMLTDGAGVFALDVAGPGGSTPRTLAETQAGYNERPTGRLAHSANAVGDAYAGSTAIFQRQLCNKCHVQD